VNTSKGSEEKTMCDSSPQSEKKESAEILSLAEKVNP
jgi:hypothetical protein